MTDTTKVIWNMYMWETCSSVPIRVLAGWGGGGGGWGVLRVEMQFFLKISIYIFMECSLKTFKDDLYPIDPRAPANVRSTVSQSGRQRPACKGFIK